MGTTLLIDHSASPYALYLARSSPVPEPVVVESSSNKKKKNHRSYSTGPNSNSSDEDSKYSLTIESRPNRRGSNNNFERRYTVPSPSSAKVREFKENRRLTTTSKPTPASYSPTIVQTPIPVSSSRSSESSNVVLSSPSKRKPKRSETTSDSSNLVRKRRPSGRVATVVVPVIQSGGRINKSPVTSPTRRDKSKGKDGSKNTIVSKVIHKWPGESQENLLKMEVNRKRSKGVPQEFVSSSSSSSHVVKQGLQPAGRPRPSDNKRRSRSRSNSSRSEGEQYNRSNIPSISKVNNDRHPLPKILSDPSLPRRRTTTSPNNTSLSIRDNGLQERKKQQRSSVKSSKLTSSSYNEVEDVRSSTSSRRRNSMRIPETWKSQQSGKLAAEEVIEQADL